MTENEVIHRLQGIFDEFFVEKVTVAPELTADQVDEWDSLTHIALVVAVEKAFDIKFKVGEVETTRNIGDFCGLILKRASDH